MRKYSWKEKARVKLDPQVAGERLERIRRRRGGEITPADVLRDARRPDSPLHPHFEWNDTAAAEAYRLSQAGYLIRHIEVEVRGGDACREARVVRAFVSMHDDEGKHYESIIRVMSDAEKRAQVVATARHELQQWAKRYRDYEELAGIFAAIDGPQLALEAA